MIIFLDVGSERGLPFHTNSQVSRRQDAAATTFRGDMPIIVVAILVSQIKLYDIGPIL